MAINKETRSTMLRCMYAFVGNLADLRDFVEVTSKLLKQQQQEDVGKSPEAYVQFILSEHESHPDIIELEADFKKAVAAKFPDRFEVIEIEKAGGEKDLQIRSRPGQDFDQSKVAQQIDRAIKRGLSLRRSALISLISASEWFAAQLLHYFLDKYPAAAGLGEKILSYDELVTFENMDDARRWVVAGKVEDILRGSFSDWVKFFTDRLKIDSAGIDEHVPYCQEACLRRNVLVHNGGMINKVYLKRLPSEIADKPKEGAAAPVDHDYFEDRLDRFEIVFVLVALEVWRKLDKADDLRYDVALQLAFDALSQERWSVARAVAHYTYSQKGVSESVELMARVNYWQSFKWSGTLDAVREQIEQWDVSAKGLNFQAAKDILLDDEASAIEKLKTLVTSGVLDATKLKDWPLFRGLRDSGALNELLKQADSSHGDVPPIEAGVRPD